MNNRSERTELTTLTLAYHLEKSRKNLQLSVHPEQKTSEKQTARTHTPRSNHSRVTQRKNSYPPFSRRLPPAETVLGESSDSGLRTGQSSILPSGICPSDQA